eukprot:scaffold312_cov409-Pavlova_lutheri.AAC.11
MDIDHPRLDVGWIRKGLIPWCLRAYTNTTEVIQFHLSRSGRPFTEDYFSKYKFLVRLPGSTGASYSRHLNFLWNKGAIVFLWESKAEEWYYHGLRENVTHVVVNEENIVQVIEECLRSPVDQQLQLVMEAQTVYQQHLSRPALALAWYRVMLSNGSAMWHLDVHPQAHMSACIAIGFLDASSLIWCSNPSHEVIPLQEATVCLPCLRMRIFRKGEVSLCRYYARQMMQRVALLSHATQHA